MDFDRHNNAYTKLREKKDKSLNDEKNLFKYEQDYEAASSEYEHYNSLLQQELPIFFQHATAFITPLFHSFYYMQLNIFYMMLEKLNAYTQAVNMDTKNAGDVESIYQQKQGDAGAQLNELSITKRGMSTAQIMSQTRAAGGGAAAGGSGLRAKAPSISSASTRFTPPISRQNSTGTASTVGAGGRVYAPPPYSPASGAGAPLASPGLSASGKRAPPPPPALKPRPSLGPKPLTATALYDFQAQNDGDLSFQVGDKITIIEKSDSTEDWWMGSLNGMKGSFPANYCQLD